MRFAVARFFVASCLFIFALFAGCSEPAAPPVDSSAPAPVSPPPALNPPETPKQAGDAAPAALPSQSPAAAPSSATVLANPMAPEGFTSVAVESGIVKLSPENTTIQVIGQHDPPRGGGQVDSDARTIVFMKFDGSMEIDPATKLPKSANAEIDATSLTAFAPNLTSHLKNPDFIDVEKYPTIKFTSTRIEPTGEPGEVKIIGNLTLKDVTNEITIPAKVSHDAGGVTVHGQVRLNRREFNINHPNIDTRTKPEIDFELAVGKKSTAPSGGGRRRQ